MYTNDYLYAVERDPNSLAHYGIRGMKWGVRKAIESGNTRRLSRQYAKAQRKLAKLEKRANSGKKYAARAAALGLGAGIAGTAAVAGPTRVAENFMKTASKATHGIANGVNAVGRSLQYTKHGKLKALGSKISTLSNPIHTKASDMFVDGMTVGHNLPYWEKGRSINRGITSGLNKFGRSIQARASNSSSKLVRQGAAKVGTKAWKASSAINKANISNGTYARIGAGVLSAGLAGAAGYNAYRAATTKRAAKKAREFRSAMNEAFKGTQYAKGGNRHGSKRRRR